MTRLLSRSLFVAVLCLALCLGAAPASRAAGKPQEISALAIETLYQEALGAGDVKPIYSELGNGFYAMQVPLSAEAVDRLRAAAQSDPEAAKASSLQTLAAGVQLSTPSSASTLIHAALSDRRLVYNHWVVVLNLGSSVTKKTTFALSGPKKFSKPFSVNYGGASIWTIWYNPGTAHGSTGVYTLKVTVDGGGSATTKFYAN